MDKLLFVPAVIEWSGLVGVLCFAYVANFCSIMNVPLAYVNEIVVELSYRWVWVVKNL